MRFLITILLSTYFVNCYGQHIDTAYHSNGKIRLIETIFADDSLQHLVYSESGIITGKGTYEIVDTAWCKTDNFSGNRYVTRNYNLIFLHDSVENVVRIGNWTEYDSIGIPRKMTEYIPFIHLVEYGFCDKKYGDYSLPPIPCAGSTMVEFLFSTVKHLDATGSVSTVEHYQDGLLIRVEEYRGKQN